MNRSRLGCLTSSGFLATLVTLAAITGIAFTRGGRMFSPGPLNAQAGEALGGVTSHAQAACKDCHTAPWDPARMADLCTACHLDVAAQMRQVASLHGSVSHRSPDLGCSHCHPDHRGPDAPLTETSLAEFPHEALGYSLAGHQLKDAALSLSKGTREAFVCADCHPDSVASFDLAVCTDCHRQADAAFTQTHAADYGGDCMACHDGVDRFSKTFTHDNLSFRLVGKHIQTECVRCHINARALADFQSAPTDCLSCHRQNDPHQGQFGSDCGACHSTEAWKPANFDHNLAAFKLEGGHVEAKCEDCHRNGVFKGTPTDCYSCHAKNDEHNGRFGKDCGQCHTPNDWENAAFDHSQSIFPLTGAHTNVRCEDCHQNGVFKGTPTACVNCHADPAFHAGQFGTDCASCHSTTAWSPAQFNGQHTFPLDHGREASGTVSCATCHPDNFATYTCYGCHEHNPVEIQAKHLEEGVRDFQDCVACHPTGSEHEGEGGGGDD